MGVRACLWLIISTFLVWGGWIAAQKTLDQVYPETQLSVLSTTHDMIDIPWGYPYELELLKMNALGLMQPSSGHFIFPNDTLSWKTLLRTSLKVKPQSNFDNFRQIQREVTNPPSRGEALRMLIDVFELDIQTETTSVCFFEDIAPDEEYFPMIVHAQEAGWFEAFQPKQFEPDRPITRGEYVAIYMNAFEQKFGDIKYLHQSQNPLPQTWPLRPTFQVQPFSLPRI